MALVVIHTTLRRMIGVALALELLMLPAPVDAETVLKPIPTQYIAALGDPGATSGTGAEVLGPVAPGSGASWRRAKRL